MTALQKIAAALARAKATATDFYNRRIVNGWYKKWSTWALAAALLAPDAIQFALLNWDALNVVFPAMDATTKERLRYALIASAFVLRQLQQPKKEDAEVQA
jgi:hypothetical protein